MDLTILVNFAKSGVQHKCFAFVGLSVNDSNKNTAQDL